MPPATSPSSSTWTARTARSSQPSSSTNLAARLCGEAKPGQILISQRVFGAVEDLVEGEALGGLTLKGFTRPVPAFDVRALRG